MFKQLLKKVIHKVRDHSIEVVKDSTSQLAKTISPAEMLKQATGSQNDEKKSEFKEYLEKIGDPNLSGEALEKKKEEYTQKDQKETEKLRTFLGSTPVHLRVAQTPVQPRAYEKTVREWEQREENKETSKNQIPFQDAPGKHKGKIGSPVKKASTSGGFERGKDKKSG